MFLVGLKVCEKEATRSSSLNTASKDTVK